MPELGYWWARGAAQQIRYMFKYLNVPFEDKKYAFGPAPEFSKDEWFSVKFEKGLDFPNLPYLIDGANRMTETMAIMKYIAKKYDPSLLGESAGEFAYLEMLAAQVGQLKTKATMPCYTSEDGDKNAVLEGCRELQERIVAQLGDRQWFLGDRISWLDFVYAELVDFFDFLSDGKWYEEFPTTKAYWDRFVSIERIGDYWASEECMKSPFNGAPAKINN